MVIDIPNGAEISQLKLTEVLYLPEVGYTLVSIGQLDEKGFDITFLGGKCTIKGPDGKQVGAVPRTGGLYCVTHDEPETAHAAKSSPWTNFTAAWGIFPWALCIV